MSEELLMNLVDEAAGVRAGEELDVSRLEPYLRKTLNAHDGEFVLEQFPGGHSNLTYFVRLNGREIVLRRPPYGSKVKAAHDMGREYTILSHIHDIYPPAPEPYFYCEDESVIGAKFYGMERVRGIILRIDKPPGFDPDADTVRRTCEGVATNLAELHALDWKKAGLGDLQRKQGSFVERQVEGWARRYQDAKTDEIPEVEAAFDWCRRHIPADRDAVLIHNDYKFDNLILDPEDITKVKGVLDWEMSTIGDPLFDLGVTLGYWVNPDEGEGISTSRCFFTKLPGSITRKEYAEVYGRQTGRDVSDIHYYYVLALAKLAGVIQQIYYRYKTGKTHDARFADMINGVRLLGERAVQVIESGEV